MTAWRWKSLMLAALCLLVAAILLWLSGTDLIRTIRHLAHEDPVISSPRYMMTGLILVPMAISLSLLFLLSKQATPEDMKKASSQSLKWTRLYLIFLLVSIIAAFLAPLAQYGTINALALRRGYTACPTPDWPRHQPDRWALPGPHGQTERCPGEGADPND